MTRYLVGFMCVLALSVMGCSETDGTGGSGGDGGADLCEGIDCDDGNECTDDTCLDGTCENTPVEDDTECGDGAATCQAGSCVGTFACTEQGIRDAIAEGGGPHTFDCAGPTTVTTLAEIEIDNDVILDGESNLTVDGDDKHRVFSVPEGVTAELRGLSVRRGTTADGGGGISNGGTLTITNSTVSDNTAGVDGGGIYNFAGGRLTLTNSTVSDNTVDDGLDGGGILNGGGDLTLTNSTVSGNSTGLAGGGIYSFAGGRLTLTNSTVSGNSAAVAGGIGADGTVTLTNTLVDNDCAGTIVSNGYNIESPGDTCGFDQTGDQPGVTVELLNLGELAANGGLTMTHKPGDGDFGDGSVAIDQIPAVDCVDAVGEPLTTDQRGLPRPAGTTDPKRCDVGAVEVQASD